jgi:hypothetical protein
MKRCPASFVNLCIIFTFSVLIACGGGGGGGSGTKTSGDSSDGDGTGGGNTSTGSNSIAEAIESLYPSVDMNQTNRVDDQQEALPDDYSPLGSSKALYRYVELFRAEKNGISPATANISKYKPATTTTAAEIETLTDTNNDFMNYTYRAATSGDVDGDGLEETLIVYKNSDDDRIYLRLVDDAEENFEEYEWPVSSEAVMGLDIECGDFDGDGRLDVAVSLVQDTQAMVLFLFGDKSTSYSPDESMTMIIPEGSTPGFLSVELAAGNIDYDAPWELVIVRNVSSNLLSDSTPNFGVTYFWIHDDAITDFKVLKEGPVVGTDGQTYTAKLANAAVGNIDADSLDEIIIAGLTELTDGCDAAQYISLAFDDGAHDLADLGQDYNDDNHFGSCESSTNPRRINHVFVNTFDLDGDQVDEVQVNQMIYEDFRKTPFEIRARIPENQFSHTFSNNGMRIRKDTAAVAVGDFTADGKEDLLVRVPLIEGVNVWGVDPTEKDDQGRPKFTLLETVPAPSYFSNNTNNNYFPLLTTVNVDMDSFIVEYSAAEYEYVFIEPVIIAVLAAPPCYEAGSGQNTDACATAFGKSFSQTVSAEAAVTISASWHSGTSAKTGFETPFIGASVEQEFEQTVTVAATAAISGAYTVTKSETFQTGPLEDTLVITTVPYDRYTYTILSHPEPEAVGKKMVLSLPREPITIQVERAFYNDHVAEGGIKIDDSILSHSIGVPRSYPTVAEKDDLLARFTPFGAPRLESATQTVGINTGQREVGISVETVVGASTTLAVSYEADWRTTGTVSTAGGGSEASAMAGFGVGVEASATLGYSVGQSTQFNGTVGGLNPNTFDVQDQYSYGMFTYVYEHPSGQQFDVINYWVE